MRVAAFSWTAGYHLHPSCARPQPAVKVDNDRV